MAILGVALLLPACLFYLYVLVRFHMEAVRPADNSRVPRARVIVLREAVAHAESRTRSATVRRHSFGTVTQAPRTPLPFGVRRLAVKHEARG